MMIYEMGVIDRPTLVSTNARPGVGLLSNGLK